VDEDGKKLSCPVGLSILATFNILSSVVGFLALLIGFFLTVLKVEGAPLIFSIPIAVRIVFPILYLITGIGYLKVRWFQGYVLGNATAIVALLSIAFSSILKGTVNLDLLQQILMKLILPVITLLLLNLKYRKLFLEAKHAKSRP
jgi:hypothetical protein